VCANAALALIVAGRATTLIEGFELAASSVNEGRAGVALERLIELSNS
jgi:anthranilate phosphoribosyltransferase